MALASTRIPGGARANIMGNKHLFATYGEAGSGF